jgi:hypothetical protein
LGPIQAIGVDEIAYAKSHKYLTLVYQIDGHGTRLLWIGNQRARLRDLLRYNLKSVRAYLLKEDFQKFWDYNSPTWAGMGKIESSTLQRDLGQFTGAETWYRHPLNRHLLYTAGVQFFVEQAGCYWFLDIVATELFQLQQTELFLMITLAVDDGEADIVADDGDGNVVFHRHIHFTDAPSGEWRFYLTDNVVLLPNEY